MACIIVGTPLPKVYRYTLSHGINIAEVDEIRDNFRFIQCVVFANIFDEQNNNFGKYDYLVDILLSEQFAKKGYVTLSNQRIAMCSYAGFERLTSQWAKKNYPECRGVITTRIVEFDKDMNALACHSVSVYY